MAPDTTHNAAADGLTIAGTMFSSRLLMGSGGYPNQQVLLDSLKAAEPALVTVALRRISLEPYAESLVDLLDDFTLLPNTAGCATPLAFADRYRIHHRTEHAGFYSRTDEWR